MTRTQLSEAREADSSQQCADCRTVAPADAPYCQACGGCLRARGKSRVAYHAIGAFIGIAAMLVYWLEHDKF